MREFGLIKVIIFATYYNIEPRMNRKKDKK